MRPIDGDALRDKLQNLADDEWNRSTPTTWAEAFAECADMVEDAPTIEPERKTGRWIKMAIWGRVYYCDQCRNYLDFDGVNVVRGSTNFCPNCGARMEGEG